MTSPNGEPQPIHNASSESRFTRNIWREPLEKQGVNFSIPERIGKSLPIRTSIKRDQITGLVIEDDDVREYIGRRLTDCIRNGEKWVALYADADNLKTANLNLGRPFGDMVIRQGTSKITRAVENAQVSPQAEILTVRQSHAADETIIWVLGVSEREIENLQRAIEEAQKPEDIQEPKYTFSSSIALVSSQDPRIEDELKNTLSWLKQEGDEEKIAFEFMEEVEGLLDNDVKLVKVEKDLLRLPLEQLLTINGVRKLHEYMVRTLGDSRISSNLLDLTLKISGIETVRAMMKSVQNREAFEELLRQFGVTEKQLTQARTADELQDLYTDLFGESDI